MNKGTKELLYPKVGMFERHVGKLVSTEKIQPPPPELETHYIFEEVEARCELRLNEEVLKILGVLSDFYGLETGVETAIKEMKEYASERNITNNSDVEVVVIRRAYQIRKLLIDRENFWAKEYFDFEPLEFGATLNLPKPVETIVWSSKNS